MTALDLRKIAPVEEIHELDPNKRYVAIVDPAKIDRHSIQRLCEDDTFADLSVVFLFARGGCIGVIEREEAIKALTKES